MRDVWLLDLRISGSEVELSGQEVDSIRDVWLLDLRISGSEVELSGQEVGSMRDVWLLGSADQRQQDRDVEGCSWAVRACEDGRSV